MKKKIAYILLTHDNFLHTMQNPSAKKRSIGMCIKSLFENILWSKETARKSLSLSFLENERLAYDPQNTILTANGTGRLSVIKGYMNGVRYQDLLEDYLTLLAMKIHPGTTTPNMQPKSLMKA